MVPAYLYIDILVGAAGLSDLGSGVWVDTLVMMALTGLDDGGCRKILWVATELHPVQRGARMEVGRLVALVSDVALSCKLILLRV